MQPSIGVRLAGLVLSLATLAVAVLNGQPRSPLQGHPYSVLNNHPFSPYFDPAFFWVGKAVGRDWLNSPFVFYGTSVIITLATLIVSWLIAVILRKIMPRLIGPVGGRLIWLAGAVLIAWPTLRLLTGVEE